MRILVTGATGAIGRSLVSQLVAAGHHVSGTTRSENKVGLIQRLGAEAIVADGLDAQAVLKAVERAKPDVVIHEMTDLTGVGDLRHFERAIVTTNLLRTRGTDHLLAAARAHGVQRFIAQSYCGWPYARKGGFVKAETDALDLSPPKALASALAAIRYTEEKVTGSSRPEGIVLRYGAFYGADTGLFSGPFVTQLRRRLVPVIGGGNGWWSFIHIEDAAKATVLAVECGRPGQIYNIVDDKPAPVGEWLPALAAMLGAKPPLHIPAWLGRLVAGEHLVVMMDDARAGSNAKAKRDLGWQPDRASWRQGFAEIVQQRAEHDVAA